MGNSAYQRGSAAISAQIDRESEDKRRESGLPLYVPYYLERDVEPIRERARNAEAELQRAKRALESSRSILALERDSRREERELLDARVLEHWKLAERYRLSWEKASAMIRALLTPEQVEQYRQDQDWMNGK